MKRRILIRALKLMLAFVVFGIIDNGIMLIAGDQIDAMFGATLGISVLAAAGLGNTLSDMVGISMGRIVEHKVFKGENLEVGLAAWQIITAETVGITSGCLIGMLFLFVI